MATDRAGSQPVLACADLRKSFGDRLAVDGVGFTIGPSETYGLLGPNGAGKTTTISMICGLLVRDGGTVLVDGAPLDVNAVAAKGAVGFVPQDLAIYPELTARENLRFFGQLYGLAGTELRSRMDEVLEIIGLADRADERTDGFSGGMKRRLNIGIGLLNRPKLLVLDEPTVGVDPQSRNAILASVEQLGEQGMAILYTTHYMEEAERLCDRVGIIDHGQIKAEGTRRELVSLIGQRDRVDLAASGPLPAAAEALRAVPGVEEATAHEGGIGLLVGEARTILPRLLEAASTAGASVNGVEIVEPDLEAVFLHLTGRALRD
ncbi:MAG TPA: ABC transporter ATP-binding protein [Patescibacteria group bacterium]|nr:ABC transporter ATP-binding protein [Patescibacteria group bacterium]